MLIQSHVSIQFLILTADLWSADGQQQRDVVMHPSSQLQNQNDKLVLWPPLKDAPPMRIEMDTSRPTTAGGRPGSSWGDGTFRRTGESLFSLTMSPFVDASRFLLYGTMKASETVADATRRLAIPFSALSWSFPTYFAYRHRHRSSQHWSSSSSRWSAAFRLGTCRFHSPSNFHHSRNRPHSAQPVTNPASSSSHCSIPDAFANTLSPSITLS